MESLATGPALAQEMNAEEAKHFVSGKLFAFNCIDRLRGAGRIYADGSVIGNIQPNGGGPVQPVWLPAGYKARPYALRCKHCPLSRVSP